MNPFDVLHPPHSTETPSAGNPGTHQGQQMTMIETTAAALQAAREALNADNAALSSVSQRMRDLEAASARRRSAAADAQAPRTEKRSLLAVILRRGGDATDAEVERMKVIDKQLAAAHLAAGTDADEAQVVAELMAEPQAEADAIHARRKPLIAALALAQFEAARAEVLERELPEFLQAAEAFRQAFGRLQGLGKAHAVLADRFNTQYGHSPGSPLGVLYPYTELAFVMPGFEIEDLVRGHPTLGGSMFTKLHLPADDVVAATAAEATARWTA